MNRQQMGVQIAECLKRLKAAHIDEVDHREIPYGIQLLLRGQEESSEIVKVNVYYSKKGMNYFLLDSGKGCIINEVIEKIFEECIRNAVKVDGCYVGTDESGKGDYFGPLVTAGFVSNRELDAKLYSFGIRDSKKISEKRIHLFAEYLLRVYPERCTILTLEPVQYNKIYSRFRAEGKKLNELLIYTHGQVVAAAIKKIPQIQLIVTDQFAKEKQIRENFYKVKNRYEKFESEKDSKRQIRILTDAEQYTAVAAASVLARHTWLKWMERESYKSGIILPKGSSDMAIKTANKLMKQERRGCLLQYAKIHFRTTNEIMKEYQENEECLYL